MIERVTSSSLWERRWLGWLFVYAVVLLFFFIYRCIGLQSLILMYGSAKDCTAGVETSALALGFLEDFVCATYFAFALWTFDTLKNVIMATFLVSWVLFIVMMGSFVADLLIVRLRDMRFTFELVAMAIHEKDNASNASISEVELNTAYRHVAGLVAVATFFAIVRTWAAWADLSRWNPAFALVNLVTRSALVVVLLLGLIILPAVVLAISQACSSLVAYSALNASLNELFIRGIGITKQGFAPSVADGNIENATIYIHSATEDYTLFDPTSLYRRTNGFHGPLAFDVNVSKEDPPNVVLIVVESFRFHDSHYLVGEEDPSNLFKGTNITVTPNFDRWARRGVSFSNMWSSWRTSRSVESLLFAQLPYDSVADSGMTGGKEDVELAGLPQLFKAKGYEPVFTTGCKTDYDDWDTFLPSHGFDTVLSRDEMMELAEGYLNISADEWYSGDHRGFSWGVHDDLSFQLLGDLLINKTTEQKERVARGDVKTPLFVNHYTISSHTPFTERPRWYAQAEKPDFSALYEDEEYADAVQDYLEMRYFTDLELGKFLDRMADKGILDDTIVVVVGDHGQGPEDGLDVPEAREISATRVAGTIIAEGRLGDSVGLVIEDAVEQYDILNTLADITGVPEGGFLQNGIGRSLKREVTFGERIVYSNNPSRKMSVVRGHERLRYDRYSSSVLLHNPDTDHEMEKDQFPTLSVQNKTDWRTWRDDGRRINAYYTKRWDKKCLLAGEC
eukprot:jgi/Phyca11/124061/e_gw1.52.109.1